jgi:Tol biopolymer transport system component
LACWACWRWRAPASARPRSRIVWTRFERGGANSARLVYARANGSDLRRLTFPSSHTQDVNAAISPDGRQIAFERDLNDGDSSKIVLKGARGDHRRVPDLGCTDPCAFLDSPTWLNSGQRIAYTPVIGPFDQVNGSARSAVLHTARTDGSDVRRLSQPGIDGKFEDYHARFSPDGSYVVFDRVRNADVHEALFRMAADGSGARRLTPWKLDAADEDLSLARSGPTKDRIVFQTYGQGPPRGKSQNIATVPATCAPVSECRAKIRYVTHHSGGEIQLHGLVVAPRPQDRLHQVQDRRPPPSVCRRHLDLATGRKPPSAGHDLAPVRLRPGMGSRPERLNAPSKPPGCGSS